MARITVEDGLAKVESRFTLVHLAAQRGRMLLKGARPLVESENRPVVTALREIAAGEVYQAVAEEQEAGDEGVEEVAGEE
ncbi:MAG: DNA-directed RNA polymerase subunit omega [Deltaproteobacteria bacterium]|nr:DNA-directed RNA polymerase subunit omega [Deltaproteobacteria bacterium]